MNWLQMRWALIPPTKVTGFHVGRDLQGVVGALSAHFLNTWNARQGTFDASIIT